MAITLNFFEYDGVTLYTTIEIESGDSIDPPEGPDREGYNFTGWEPDDFDNITEDTDYVAQYDIKNVNEIRLGVDGDMQILPQFGRTFEESYEDGLFREERSADATLRRDVISRKKNYVLSYETADQEVVDRLEYLYGLSGPLKLEVNHLTNTGTVTKQVFMAPFSQQRILATWGGLWSGVAIELREV